MKINPNNSPAISQTELPATTGNPPMDPASGHPTGRRMHEAVEQAFDGWNSAKQALTSEVGLPALDAGSKDPAKMTIHFAPEHSTLPDLDANANAVAIEHLKLENEGWERDKD